METSTIDSIRKITENTENKEQNCIPLTFKRKRSFYCGLVSSKYVSAPRLTKRIARQVILKHLRKAIDAIGGEWCNWDSGGNT